MWLIAYAFVAAIFAGMVPTYVMRRNWSFSEGVLLGTTSMVIGLCWPVLLIWIGWRAVRRLA